MNHLLCILVREWSNSEGNVSEDLDVDPSKTEGNERSKQWIFGHANHQFEPIPNHFLYNDTFHAILFNFIEGAPDFVLILKIQTNCADVRFMKHALRGQLGCHWKTKRGRNHDRLVRRSGQTSGNLRYSKRR